MCVYIYIRIIYMCVSVQGWEGTNTQFYSKQKRRGATQQFGPSLKPRCMPFDVRVHSKINFPWFVFTQSHRPIFFS